MTIFHTGVGNRVKTHIGKTRQLACDPVRIIATFANPEEMMLSFAFRLKAQNLLYLKIFRLCPKLRCRYRASPGIRKQKG